MSIGEAMRRLFAFGLALLIVVSVARPAIAMTATPPACAEQGHGCGPTAMGSVTTCCCDWQADPATPALPSGTSAQVRAAASTPSSLHELLPSPTPRAKLIPAAAPAHGYHSVDLHTLFSMLLI